MTKNPNTLASLARELSIPYKKITQCADDLSTEYVKPGDPAVYMAAEVTDVNSMGGFWVAYPRHVGAYGHQTDHVRRRAGSGSTAWEARGAAIRSLFSHE